MDTPRSASSGSRSRARGSHCGATHQPVLHRYFRCDGGPGQASGALRDAASHAPRLWWRHARWRLG
eukprot:3164182-Alexandrium_andersonii.AAC.1